MISDKDAPIGIFDSGIGGLTVARAIGYTLPNESLIYLGDTARVPYGTKSAETILRYSMECADFLVQKRVKAVVVACNTASAYALCDLQKKFKIPVIGVIEPGARAAARASKMKSVGVIGTWGTISSNAYGKALTSIDEEISVISKACPLFVSLAEEGWTDNEVARAAAERYLAGFKSESIDVLILACTHYPLLKDVIAGCMGDNVMLVDSAETTANSLEDLLREKGLVSSGPGSREIYVTDLPAKFETMAKRFLGPIPSCVTRVDL
jgi:glutamate racemase